VLLHVTNILSGFVPYILSLVLTSLGATEIASYVSAPTPTGTLLGGLQDLQNLSDSNSADIWSWENNIPKRVIFFSVQTLFFILLLYVMESRSLKITSDSSNSQETFRPQATQEELPDISLERQRLEMKSSSDPVLLKHIYKCYSSRPVVNDISLGVKRGECLGYLGPNGAGLVSDSLLLFTLIPFLLPSSFLRSLLLSFY
jgi:ABC-type multidrug transport system fused ATPase/permease subunit